MRFWRFALFLLVVQVFSLPAAAEHISWYVREFPPYMFGSTYERGDGPCDQGLIGAMSLLPDHQHEVIQRPFKAALTSMKTDTATACDTCMKRTADRESFMYFSDAITPVASNGLIINQIAYEQYQPYINELGEIDLIDILRDPEIVIGTRDGRSYGSTIDKILQPFLGTHQVFTTDSGIRADQVLYRRLFHNSFYTGLLGYAEEAAYQLDQLGIDRRRMLFFQLKGTRQFEPQNGAHIGCTKTELGRQIISRINANMDQLRGPVGKAYRRWLDPESQLRHLHSTKALYN